MTVDTTPQTDTRVITYSEAVREAIGQAMEADDRVFMLGEDIGVYGGAFGVSGDLYHRFGADRIRDTPISELGIVGAGVGMALSGLLPIVEIQFSDFTAQAMDQIVNQAAKIHFMLGGAARVPLVLRAPGGSGTNNCVQLFLSFADGTKEVKVYKRVDEGPLMLIEQGRTTNSSSVVQDCTPIANAGDVCYFAQAFDEHGNASALVPIGTCIKVGGATPIAKPTPSERPSSSTTSTIFQIRARPERAAPMR